MANDHELDTAPQPPGSGWVKFEATLRVVVLIVLAGIFVSAAIGWLGVRSTTNSGAIGDADIEVEYAQVARPGLSVPFRVSVSSDAGLPDVITVAVTSDYLDVFEQHGRSPTPATESSDGTFTRWTFETAGVAHFDIDLDARIDPAVQWRRDGEVEVEIDGRTTTIEIRTWVLP